jgi:hypothetical protein
MDLYGPNTHSRDVECNGRTERTHTHAWCTLMWNGHASQPAAAADSSCPRQRSSLNMRTES